jgi:cell division inhibitor SepF
MSAVTNWFKEFVAPSGSTKAQAPSVRTAPASSDRQSRVARPQRRGNDVSSIETVTPGSFADAGLIAEVLRDGIPVVVNVQNLTDTDTRRLVDFMAGLKAGLLATSKRVAEQVYLIAPLGVEVDGDPDDVLEAESDKLIIRP